MKNYFILLLFILSCNYSFNDNSNNGCDECDVSLKTIKHDSLVCKFVDEMPSFPEGNNKFLEYMYSNMVYEQDSVSPFQSNFKISYIVDRNGKIVRAKVVNRLERDYTLMEKHLIHLMENSPQWNSGRCKGKSVPVFKVIYLKLSLE